MEQAEPGPCRGYFERWAFVPQKLMCVSFGYGGCRGNRNNFLTAEECSNTCGIVSAVSEYSSGGARRLRVNYFFRFEQFSVVRL